MALFKYLITISVLLCCMESESLVSGSCIGCVDLDRITFSNLISKFPYALIKFDIAFPYGEKHETFGQFALKAHQVTSDLLVGLVGIKDYGEKDNSELGTEYGVNQEAFPEIFLFRNNVKDYVKFPSEMSLTVGNLKEFVTQNSNLYIGLDGCLKEFSQLVSSYGDKNKSEQKNLIEDASNMLNKITDEAQKASATAYIAFMRKIYEKDCGFVKDETARLTKLKSGKVTASKKLELSHKLNILQSFKCTGIVEKIEL